MDYQKLDAALAAALEDVENQEAPVLEVFVTTASMPSPPESDFLRRLGIAGAGGGKRAFTARLSAGAVRELSDQPWVRSVKLARRLRPLAGGA